MIDEEDDEEILTRRVSLKTVLKSLFVILLIGLGAIIIYIGIFPGDQVLNFIIGFALICFGTSIIQYETQPAEPDRQTLTILKCMECGLKEVRNYSQGDFVYKIIGNCVKCNKSMQIEQIYTIKFKKQDKKEKKRKLLAQKSSKEQVK